MSVFDLFRPRWQHSNWKVRMESVEKLTDQKKLARIALTDKESRVRESINDVKILGEIAVNPKSEKYNINIDLSKKAVQVLAGIGSPEAITMLIEVLKANSGNECKLEAIIALQNMNGRPELPNSIVTEMLMLFREWLKNTDQFVLEGDVDDAKGEYYAENKLYTRLNHAISWLEKMVSESDYRK